MPVVGKSQIPNKAHEPPGECEKGTGEGYEVPSLSRTRGSKQPGDFFGAKNAQRTRNQCQRAL